MQHLIAGINVPILPYTAGINAVHNLSLSGSTMNRQGWLRSGIFNDGEREKKKIWSLKQQFDLN